jgi:hypothetical protein
MERYGDMERYGRKRRTVNTKYIVLDPQCSEALATGHVSTSKG